MSDLLQNIGNKIRQERQKREWLQRDLSVQTGLPVRTIGRIERGEVDVRIGTLKKIADALGVAISDLVLS